MFSFRFLGAEVLIFEKVRAQFSTAMTVVDALTSERPVVDGRGDVRLAPYAWRWSIIAR